MPGQSGRGLFLPRKDSAEKRDVTQTFQEIERWTMMNWNNPVFAAGWSKLADATYQTPRFMLDPFAFTIIEGYALYTGTILTGTVTPIWVLPPRFRPPLKMVFPVGVNPDPRIDIYPNGTVNLNQFTGASLVNPVVNLSGIRFAVFN